MLQIKSFVQCLLPGLLGLALNACGGGGESSSPAPAPNYSISGAVSGLSASGLVLQNNGGGSISVAANATSVNVASGIASGATYAIAVLSQPAGQTCAVANGSGTATANVTNVSVTCVSNPAIQLALSSNTARTRDDVTLTWSSTNATSCTATGNWSGTKALSGNVVVSSPTAATLNYALSCSNASGQSANGTASLAIRARTASDYYAIEDTGLVIPNDNPDTTRFPTSIARLDLNGDSYEDAIIVGPELPNGTPPSPLTVSYFKTQTTNVILGGPTTLEGSAFFPLGRPSYKVSNYPVLYDFNGDGLPDIVIPDLGADANPFPGAQTNIWLSGGGVWRPATMQQVTAGAHGGSAGTIAGKRVFLGNNLGCGFCTELTPFTYDYTGSGFVLSRSTLPAIVTETGPGVTTAAARRWTGSAIADVDGDGFDDLVLGDFGAGEPNDTSPGNYIAFGNATDWKGGAPLRLPDPQGTTLDKLVVLTVVVTDINRDGRKDIVIGYTDSYNTRGIQILINSGNRTFVDSSSAMLGANAYVSGNPSGQLTVIDLNGDLCLDIVEPEPSAATSQKGRWLFNDCSGHFVDATSALAPIYNALPNSQVLLPFKDFTGRTSFYAPSNVAPAAGSSIASTRYKKLKNLENLPTPVNGAIVF